MKLLKQVTYAVALPLALLALWWLITLGEPNVFFPSPEKVLTAFAETWFGERLLVDVLPSVGRLLLGLVLAIVFGIAAGLLIGSIRWLREMAEPALEFIRAVPPPVLIPVLMLLMGITDAMKVFVIALGCVWPVLLNTVEGVRATDSVLSDTTQVYGLSGWARVRYLVLPAATPQIIAGIRISLSIGLILMVVSEMFASASGLGFAIIQFQRSYAIADMWSGIVILGLIGLGMSLIYQWCERRILRWYHGLKEVENAV